LKSGTVIETPRLVLRPWADGETDRAAFHRLNSDEQVMRFFPYRLTRTEADLRFDAVRAKAVADGFGWGTAVLKSTGENIAFLGVARTSLAALFGDAVEIGWRFLPEHWGKGLASEAAGALRDHAFADLGLKSLIALAVPANAASLAVMRRIGMRHDPSRDFDHPNVPETHPHLKRHVYFAIDRPTGREQA
jgi:RimJ/RimL family protein N-acetyltransferase